MNAIETTYKGYRFRSRLEARWAVFFDALGIKWQYEKEGYNLLSGKYLPDFYLPEVSLRDEPKGVWLEIKGMPYTDEERVLCGELGALTKKPVVIAVGLPEADGGLNNLHQIHPFWDNCMLFMQCNDCGHIKIEFWEGNYYVCPECNHTTSDIPMQAVEAARSSRFEFGQSGAL